MQALSSINQALQQPQFMGQASTGKKGAIKFSSLPDQVVKSLGSSTQKVYKMMAPLHASRGLELLVIDLGGWATLRTLMDLYRQKFFKKTIDDKKQLNYVAARERLMMEVMGALPDSIGLLAFLYGMAAEGKRNAFSNKFIDQGTLKLFDNMLKNPQNKSSQTFMQSLTKLISPEKASSIEPLVAKALNNANFVDDAAVKIAKVLGQKSFDRTIANSGFSLDTLLGDANSLISAASKGAKNSPLFAQTARKLIASTTGINAWRIPLGLALGAAYNFVSPYFIQGITRKVEGINDYPGEDGLRKLQKVDKRPHIKSRGLLPYLKETLAQGNPIPALLSLVPLPVIFGMVDTEKWATHGFKAAFNSPLKSGFVSKAMKMFQFSRSAPFVGMHQMAVLQALVVFSRVTSARNAVEFRERVFDSYLGWGIWILGSPLIKKAISAFYDKTQGTQLLKTVNGAKVARTQSEIASLIKNPTVMRNTLSKNIWIGFGSLVATMGLLGIVEPWLSIKLTEWQSKRVYGNHTEPMPKFSKNNTAQAVTA